MRLYKHGKGALLLKPGIHLKAVFWLGIMFSMHISRLRFKQSRISMLISHIYVLGSFVNFLVIFRYIWRCSPQSSESLRQTQLNVLSVAFNCLMFILEISNRMVYVTHLPLFFSVRAPFFNFFYSLKQRPHRNRGQRCAAQIMFRDLVFQLGCALVASGGRGNTHLNRLCSCMSDPNWFGLKTVVDVDNIGLK